MNRLKLLLSRKKMITLFCIILLVATSIVVAMNLSKGDGSGDPKYEATKIEIEGLNNGKKAITIADLRKLPQHKLDASYKRTTGKYEKFKMEGPYLSELIKELGGDISDYEGIGVQGSDAYYCLIPREVIEKTPDLMIAVKVDGKAKLSDTEAPARLGVQGQYGPYWVKKINKIILYKEVPKKEITSVWIFKNLAEGIEPYKYEYYGSKDSAIEIEKIFARLDNVDSKAFFTMKSSDGFEKNEAINMVKSRYYIKVEGVDSPTNISPYIKLGMNVKHISWISTNADAAVFPEQLEKYLDTWEVKGKKGIPLSEIMYEVKVKKLKGITFDLISTTGETETVSGEQLKDGILNITGDGQYSVLWKDGTKEKDINNLMRIRISNNQPTVKSTKDSELNKKEKNSSTITQKNNAVKEPCLTISGNGVNKTSKWSLEELKGMKSSYVDAIYSTVNNWPTKKFVVAKGIDIQDLLSQSGMKANAKTIKVQASDGYYATFTKSQLLGKRYYFPGLLNDSKAKSKEVKAILAFEYKEGTTDLSKTKPTELRLVIGQVGLNDMNTMASVQKVSNIIISTDDTGKWEIPNIRSISEKSENENQVEIMHTFLDKVRIYYTLDGSEPNYDSLVYNSSTTYFQPELIVPIKVSGNATLKAFASGFGKEDSEVATWKSAGK